MTKKTTEEKIVIKQFKDGSSNYWVDGKHYYLDKNNEVHFAAGGIDTEELREALRQFIKRNKKVYKPREVVAENRVYEALFSFGKHNGRTTYEVFLDEPKYCLWVWENYTFKSGDEKLKMELKELLRK